MKAAVISRVLRRATSPRIVQLGPLDGALGHLGVQQAEPAGHVHVQPQLLQLGAVHGRHVDREADDAAQQDNR